MTVPSHSLKAVVIYTPRWGLKQADWPQLHKHLKEQAARLQRRAEIFDLSRLMHDLKYFSTAEIQELHAVMDAIESYECTHVWFAGNGISEAARVLVRVSMTCKKPISDMSHRQGNLVKYINWHSLPADPGVQSAVA